MALTYVGTGTITYSTGNPQAGTVANAVGDLLILAIGTKPDTTPATTPAGWTLLGAVSGGTGTTGIDTGPMRIGIFYKIATSASEALPAVTVTGNNVSAAQAFAWRAAAGSVFDIVGTGAADTTTGTPFSATMPLNPGLTVNDALMTFGVIPTDVGAAAQFSAETVAATGMTTVTMTEINEWSTATGQDMGGYVARGTVVTGTSTAAPVVSATAGGTTTNVAGPIFLVRIREVPLTTKTVSDTGTLSATESATVTQIAPPVSLSLVDATTGALNNVATTWQSTSFAMPANGLVVVTLSITGSTSDTGTRTTSVVSSTFSGMGPWNMVQGSGSGVTAKTGTYTFWSLAGSSPGTGTILVDIAGAVADFEVSAHVMTNVDQTTPVVGVVGGMADAVGTLSMTLGATPTSSDLVFVGITSRNDSTGGGTPIGAGLTKDYATIGASPNATQYIIEGRTTDTTVGASGLNTVHNSGTAIIVKAAPLSTPSTPISASDTGTLSITGQADIAAILSASDSGTISATDASSLAASSNLTDTTTISAIESSANLITSSTSDSGTLSATDTASVTVTLATADSATLSATEASSNALSSTRPDAGTLSASEVSTNASTLGRSDSGTLSATDVSANAITSSTSDSGTISATDTAVVTVTISTSDAGTLSASDTTSAMQIAFATTDSGTLSATDVSATFKAYALTDTSTLSATETASTTVTLATGDSGTLSAADALTAFMSDGKSLADSGTISGTETSSVSSTGTANDTGTISAADASSLVKNIALTDSGTVSAVETAVVFNDRPASDSGILSATETSSVVVTGTISKSVSDTGTLSAAEVATVLVKVAVSDTSTLSAAETNTGASTVTRTDSGTISAADASALLKAMVRTDAGTFSATESSSITVFTGTTVKVWAGAGWITGTLKVWNGTMWKDVTIKRWNGTSWI